MTTGRLRPTESNAVKIGAGLAENLGARVHIDVTIPRTSIAGRMRLVDRSESLAITAETRRLFKTIGLIDDQGRVVSADDWNAEIAVRHLALAVRNPEDTGKPLDSLEEWRLCDDDQIEALWSSYRDLRQQIDPLSDESTPVSDADLETMRTAVKKKESSVLMSFGSRKLASFILTSAEQPAS